MFLVPFYFPFPPTRLPAPHTQLRAVYRMATTNAAPPAQLGTAGGAVGGGGATGAGVGAGVTGGVGLWVGCWDGFVVG